MSVLLEHISQVLINAHVNFSHHFREIIQKNVGLPAMNVLKSRAVFLAKLILIAFMIL